MLAQRFRDECNNSRLRAFLDDGLPEPQNGELAEHLTHCEACRQTLERLAAGSRLWAELRQAIPATGPLPPAAHPANEPHGTPPGDPPAGEVALDFLEPSGSKDSLGRLGPYEVMGVLGRGGFGIVLKACDPALNRTVAIKVLAPQLAVNGVARSRFAREARAAAAVVHDNVVAIHAVDAINGMPYLVMPFITCLSLQQRVDRDGSLAIKEVLRIGMQTALGLAAAHGQGLVHRDVKPSNILLENGVERVKLSDFGLARAVDDASLTQSGVVTGTPQYMSPEQARGEAVDHRSDLFGLGSVLYFMCAGHPPFRADSTPAVLRRVCDDRPRPLRAINADVPVWLAEIVERLHAKEPGGRYGSATVVAEVLQHHLSELQRTGTSAPLRPIPQAPVRKRSGRKPIAALLLTLVVVIAGVMGGFSLLPPGEQSPLAAGGPGENVKGSGKLVTKEFKVAGFSSVAAGQAFEVEITKGDSHSVKITVDDNLASEVTAVNEGTTLHIGLNSKNKSFQNAHLKAAVTMPRLEGIKLDGACHATFQGFDAAKAFTADLSSASRLTATIKAEKVSLTASGASKVTLKGSAKESTLNASGASTLALNDFTLTNADVHLSGASRATLNVQGKLDYELSGASTLKYQGSPSIGKKVKSGASRAQQEK